MKSLRKLILYGLSAISVFASAMDNDQNKTRDNSKLVKSSGSCSPLDVIHQDDNIQNIIRAYLDEWTKEIIYSFTDKRILEVTSDDKLISANPIETWDLNTNKLLNKINLQGLCICFKIFPDGKRIVVHCYDNIKIIDLLTGNILKEIKLENNTSMVHLPLLQITSDGKKIVIADYPGTIKIYDSSGELLNTIEKPFGITIYALIITPDNKKIIINARDMSIKFCNGIDKKNDSTDNVIEIWDLETAELVKTFPAIINTVQGFLVTPDSKKLIARHYKRVLIWDLDNYKLLKEFSDYYGSLYIDDMGYSYTKPGVIKQIFAFALMDDGNKLVLGFDDGSIKILDINQNKFVATLNAKEFETRIDSIVVTSDKKIIAGSGCKLLIWKNLAVQLEKVTNQDLSKEEQVRALCSKTDNVLDKIIHKCVKCGQNATQRCSGCKKVYYCSTDCQKADWSTHKSNCNKKYN